VKRGSAILIALILALGALSNAYAGGYTCTSIDYPGASSTSGHGTAAIGINDGGTITGLYYDSAGQVHGFVLSGGTYTSLDYPDARLTQAFGVNNAGTIVGNYMDASGVCHGFLAIRSATAPAVASRTPSSGATDVPVGSAITATFNTAMNASTITASTFTLSNGVTGTVAYDPSTLATTFTPSVPLAYNTTYAATITTGAEDSAGQGLSQAYTWSFTTAAAPPALSLGWNLVSLPLQPANASATSVLSGMSGTYDVVWAYPGQSWQFYDPNNQAGSAIKTIQAGTGYWIDMASTGTLTVSGSAPPSSLSLSKGWNLVGYNGWSCAPASTALSSLGNALEVSWSYAGQTWKVYDPNDTAGSTLAQFCPNYGYWIKVNQTAKWSGW